jgi:phage host-nuclease inhibitor protein Gam
MTVKINEKLQLIEQELEEIKDLKNSIEELKNIADDEVSKVKKKYSGRIQKLMEELNEKDRKIKKYMKTYKSEIFGDAEIVDLRNGRIFQRVLNVVRKARNVTVDALKKLGYYDGIRIEEYVDWDSIEKWPDERLEAIGTERKEKEEYSYELKIN